MIKDNGSHEKPPLFSRHLFSSFEKRFIARGDVILHATTSLLSNAALQAGMARLRVNDVDKHAFHRQLGRTDVAQARGMDTLLNAGLMRESWQERADRAGLQRVIPARPTLAKAGSFASRTAGSATIPLWCIIHRFLVFLLHCCGFSYDYGIAKGAQNMRSI